MTRNTWISMALASVFILFNWLIYVIAVSSNHVLEASLGYFINPLFTVALGCIFLRERLTRLQIIALCLGLAAVIVICLGYGAVPWLSLTLAASFALYSLVKKQVGPNMDALTGLTIESAMLFPLALTFLIWQTVAGTGTFTTHGATHAWLLAGSGVITALPLLAFAAAAHRIPLSILGLTQYLTPVVQFLLGIWYFHEPMPFSRLIGFALVWLAIMVLTYDSLARLRTRTKQTQCLPEVG